ncbi:hypothetical protein PPL_04413 [Heterostelium album PN500]|uniref:Uncharacterized protein n=1 Tax=Heterostelium pallidum (strain ATCC 26659 / Pp 5 / PN500) TaxID=670386 RepID=D3B7H5_HETP5|nr:hypothetical protein PPL_04413 [Heterostelium album PN500]EFA82718.1 hypothetical protein PPL_04413 [Heterostelium album PN500]|eukprot:XP_020434835.1 hypothetical protein PPL_04413 [Heterostelium album PN500]
MSEKSMSLEDIKKAGMSSSLVDLYVVHYHLLISFSSCLELLMQYIGRLEDADPATNDLQLYYDLLEQQKTLSSLPSTTTELVTDVEQIIVSTNTDQLNMLVSENIEATYTSRYQIDNNSTTSSSSNSSSHSEEKTKNNNNHNTATTINVVEDNTNNNNTGTTIPDKQSLFDYNLPTEDEVNEIPNASSLSARIFFSWLFGLCNMIVLMLFNPLYPMHFIWGVLCVGCCMTAIFALAWSSLLLNFKVTFLVFFSSTVYWMGTPITWHILYVNGYFPPTAGIFTIIFPFEVLNLVLLTMVLPKSVRKPKGATKRIIAAYCSLWAPYLTFVTGVLYLRLFQFSNEVGRILLPPVYTILMKAVHFSLDIVCIRCAQTGSNLFIILGRVLHSYYSFVVISYVKDPVSLTSIIFSKIGVYVLTGIAMRFPIIEETFVSYLPKNLVEWKRNFERGVILDDDDKSAGTSTPVIRNEFDRMYAEYDNRYSRLHSDATNLWFSMFCDLMGIIYVYTIFIFGRFGPSFRHYNRMFPFGSDIDPLSLVSTN